MHTPTPWKIGKHGSIVTDNPDRQVEIAGENANDTIEFYGGHVICETVTPDNAAFIVETCNRAEAAEARAAQLQAEAAQYKSDAVRFESERNTAIDCAEDYKAIIAQMKAEYKAQIEQLRGELATVKAELDKAQDKIKRMTDALGSSRAWYIADDYAHIVGGECGYTKSLRQYSNEAAQ